MKEQKLVVLPEQWVVSIHCRTNNQNEMSPETAKIGQMVRTYDAKPVGNQITHRARPGVVIAGYTEYDSDEHGDYTYFIGEVVSQVAAVLPLGLRAFRLPAGSYQKFTTVVGPIPDIIINAWMEIWAMTPAQLGAKRVYQNDFEVYDQRVQDHQNAQIDIYVGI